MPEADRSRSKAFDIGSIMTTPKLMISKLQDGDRLSAAVVGQLKQSLKEIGEVADPITHLH